MVPIEPPVPGAPSGGSTLDTLTNPSPGGSGEITNPNLPEATLENTASIHEVVKGDTVWGLIENDPRLAAQLAGLNPAQQAYVVDALKDTLAEMSPQQLRDIGISSGNIDALQIGDEVNLSSLFEDKAMLESITKNAKGLSPDQMANITRIISENAQRLRS